MKWRAHNPRLTTIIKSAVHFAVIRYPAGRVHLLCHYSMYVHNEARPLIKVSLNIRAMNDECKNRYWEENKYMVMKYSSKEFLCEEMTRPRKTG